MGSPHWLFTRQPGRSKSISLGGVLDLGALYLRIPIVCTLRGVLPCGRHLCSCNLTVLQEPGQEDLAEFLAKHKVCLVQGTYKLMQAPLKYRARRNV